jgi:hypothetical protein
LPMDGFPSDGLMTTTIFGTLMPFGAPSTPSYRMPWRTDQIDLKHAFFGRLRNGREEIEA